MTTTFDLAWAAGFLEGEGTFYFSSSCVHIAAAQVQREPVERLYAMFGGRIQAIKPSREGWQPQSKWVITGPRAAGLCMTLYKIMSPRRKAQIRKALAQWRDRPALGRWRSKITHCPQGHAYTPDNTYIHTGRLGDKHRGCKICCIAWTNESRRKARAGL